jgi:hypothetical protein
MRLGKKSSRWQQGSEIIWGEHRQEGGDLGLEIRWRQPLERTKHLTKAIRSDEIRSDQIRSNRSQTAQSTNERG